MIFLRPSGVCATNLSAISSAYWKSMERISKSGASFTINSAIG